jgi:GMP synthase-like glutamine amidotransferase
MSIASVPVKPVAIFRHSPTEGPGYFATFLDRAGIPWQLVKVDAGEAVPASADQFGGLVFMGGPMSVNDDLAWIPGVLGLIRTAVARDVPVLGHCLGGQLMSRALGGTVSRTPVKEIGWGQVYVAPGAVGQEWFGPGCNAFTTFQWHGETFSIPPGTTPVLSSPWCQNQGFALGPHLGMQCHIEMTEELVRSWCQTGEREIARRPDAAVQPAARILADLEARLKALQAVADRVYARWVSGLKA